MFQDIQYYNHPFNHIMLHLFYSKARSYFIPCARVCLDMEVIHVHVCYMQRGLSIEIDVGYFQPSLKPRLFDIFSQFINI